MKTVTASSAGLRLALAGALCALGALLAGCGTAPVSRQDAAPAVAVQPQVAAPAEAAVAPAAPEQGGAASPDKDGPPLLAEIPPNLAQTPDAVPRLEAKTDTGNPESYSVEGEKYKVLSDSRGFRQKGYASWYGRKFQGKRTSSGESYDMFKMTAAHKTLPIPCYVRVTNVANGRSVVVRVNDRGPFRKDRVIDLSYTAALKLAILGNGSTPVEIAALEPAPLTVPTTLLAQAGKPAPARSPAAAAPAVAAAKPGPKPVVGPAVVPAAAPVPSPATAPAPVMVASAAPPPAVTASPAATSAPAAAAAAGAGEPLRIASMSATPDPPAPAASGPHFLQAGLFSDPINAVTMREQLNGMGIANVLLKSEARGAAFVHRVLIGPFADSQTLDLARKRLTEVQMAAVPVIN
ncbi:MAG: septal ring lytic transglycosylase RlpA family protein [Nevskia sp.]|nr:septal ring lytic transglycosylase RlpA family protein [Nevskia sp.]